LSEVFFACKSHFATNCSNVIYRVSETIIISVRGASLVSRMMYVLLIGINFDFI